MQHTTEFKDLVLIDDVSKYTEDQIQDVIKRATDDRMFGEIHSAPVEFWDITRASHIVKNIHITDNKLVGDVCSIGTVFGKMLDDMSLQFDMKKYVRPAMFNETIRTFHFII